MIRTSYPLFLLLILCSTASSGIIQPTQRQLPAHLEQTSSTIIQSSDKINEIIMPLLKTRVLLAFLQLTSALPKPVDDVAGDTDAGVAIGADLAAMRGTVCNCANMQGVDLGKATFGINQCTILVINNVFRCALDSNRQLGYECPNVNGTSNCNVCAQSRFEPAQQQCMSRNTTSRTLRSRGR